MTRLFVLSQFACGAAVAALAACQGAGAATPSSGTRRPAAPAPAADLPALEIAGKRFTRRALANGLQAIAVELPPEEQPQAATVFVVYAAGKRMEGPLTTGLAHLTEHALYSGTATTPAGEHDRIVGSLGAESNAFTREDYTLYYDAGFPPDELPRVLALEADRMRSLSWQRDAVLHERYRLELEESETSTAAMAREELIDAVVFRQHPYAAGVLDADGHTRGPRLTVAQVRAFYDAHYHPDRAAVVVVAPGDPARTLDRVEAAFSGVPAGPAPAEFPVERALGGGSVAFPSDLLNERTVHAWVGPARDEALGARGGPVDRVALGVLAWVLERRSVAAGSGVRASQGGRIDRDRFTVEVAEAAEGGAEASIEALETLVRTAREAGITPEELRRAQRALGQGYRSQPLVGRPYFSLAATVGIHAALGEAEYPLTYERTLAALTADDVQAAAQHWLAPETRWAVTFLASGEAAAEDALPDDPKALAELAERLQASGELGRAAEIYQELAERTRDRKFKVIHLYSAGSLWRELGDLAKARAALEQALGIVDYPAVRTLLEEVEEQEREGGSGAAAATAAPRAEPSVAEPAPRSAFGVAPDPELAPAIVAEAEELMGRIEAWRGRPFLGDVRLELTDGEGEDAKLAGFYDPLEKRLVVHGGRSETFARGTLLHELVHALQDQHWDLAALHDAATTREAERALAALIEGEAMLAVSELMDYDFLAHANLTPPGALDEARFGKIFRYGSGMRFVLALRGPGGWDAIDAAWASPPASTRQVFRPELYLAASVEDAAGAEQAAEAQGAYGLYVWLARSEATRAAAEELSLRLAADRYRAAEGGGAQWTLEFEDASAADAFGSALELNPAAVATADRAGPQAWELVLGADAAALPQ